MSAKPRVRRDKLAAATVSSSVAAAGTIADSVAILKADLNQHECKAAELRALLSRLENYAGTAPPAQRAPAKRKPDRPPINDDAKRKRRQRSTGGLKNTGVKAEISGWTTDADGNICRSLVAEGERVPLKDERPPAT